ncbi:MAG: hypothetical protein OEZ01_02900 [Candidatus Heimdallarchaeota archaeon]|nr:hypothetical protein [Candidatus Heimdallarchaeota archaeon]MDH5644926.1 hypothetical protein [Candidatus Heimdallarchaeota archaeon]
MPNRLVKKIKVVLLILLFLVGSFKYQQPTLTKKEDIKCSLLFTVASTENIVIDEEGIYPLFSVISLESVIKQMDFEENSYYLAIQYITGISILDSSIELEELSKVKFNVMTVHDSSISSVTNFQLNTLSERRVSFRSNLLEISTENYMLFNRIMLQIENLQKLHPVFSSDSILFNTQLEYNFTVLKIRNILSQDIHENNLDLEISVIPDIFYSRRNPPNELGNYLFSDEINFYFVLPKYLSNYETINHKGELELTISWSQKIKLDYYEDNIVPQIRNTFDENVIQLVGIDVFPYINAHDLGNDKRITNINDYIVKFIGNTTIHNIHEISIKYHGIPSYGNISAIFRIDKIPLRYKLVHHTPKNAFYVAILLYILMIYFVKSSSSKIKHGKLSSELL